MYIVNELACQIWCLQGIEVQYMKHMFTSKNVVNSVLQFILKKDRNGNTVKPAYKRHSRESVQMPFKVVDIYAGLT